MRDALSPLPSRALLLAVATFTLSLLAVHLRPPGCYLAIWWPAAAVAVGGLLLARPGRERAVLAVAVLAATAVASAAGGRPATLSLAFGAANAAEAWVVSWWFTRRTGGVARLRTLDDAGRFLVAVLLGAVLAGVLAGAAAGAHGLSALQGFRVFAPAHAAAVLLGVPLVLLGRGPRPLPRRTREGVAQWAALAVVAGSVFAPGQRLPLTFLLLPVLVWGATRFSARTSALQVLLLAAGVSVATLHGWGPFAAAAATPEQSVWIVQLFLVTLGLVLLPLSMVVQQRLEDLTTLRLREELFRLTFEEALVGMLVLRYVSGDATLRVVRANDVASRILGRAGSDLSGTALCDLLHHDEHTLVRRAVSDLVEHDLGAWHGEVRTHDEGEQRWMEIALTRLPGGSSGVVLSAQLVDVTERHQAQRQLQRLALTDALTGLANRVQLEQRAATLAHRDPSAVHALLFCDLDGFKAVNDAAGHAVGDAVLVEVARRLRRAARAQDMVARVGGDEFVLLCPEISTPDDAGAIARHVADEFAADVVVDGAAYRLGISVGIALTEAGGSFDAALRSADRAMYEAKAEQRRRLRSLDQDELVFSVN